MRKTWLVAMCVFAQSLAGCEVLASPNELIKAPALDAGLKEVNQAVMEYLPAGAKFAVPLTPREAGAVQQVDLDGDGRDEILAFYKKEPNLYQLGLLVLTKGNSGWEKAADFTGAGLDFHNVQTTDLTGDHHPELIVGMQAEEGMDRELTVYTMKGKRVQPLWKQTYANMAVGDLDGDAQAEIVLVQHDREQLTARAELYQMKNQQMTKQTETPLDGSVNLYTQVMIGKATPAKRGVFIDAGLGAHSAVTDLLFYEKGTLVNAFASNPDEGNSVTFKAYPLDSMDVNGDGIVEIGMQTEPAGSEGQAMVEIPWIQSWYQWTDKGSLKLISENYADYYNGWEWKIPTQWIGHYTVKKQENATEKTVEFFYLDPSGVVRDSFLKLGITAKDPAKDEERGVRYDRTHIELGEKGGKVYWAEWENPGYSQGLKENAYKQLLLDENEIRKHFEWLH
ncbi:VCBS repeat-containing protein [Brevibacillus dissolubilis]|uniref:VCBS repeat-containing protein n=1 Tax=Brevibacillus dissolubilis TaxID=1844116 RepID=UPI0011175631|nr:VCBS repeat-containing protein [Brevibacillus dissolubilis]